MAAAGVGNAQAQAGACTQKQWVSGAEAQRCSTQAEVNTKRKKRMQREAVPETMSGDSHACGAASGATVPWPCGRSELHLAVKPADLARKSNRRGYRGRVMGTAQADGAPMPRFSRQCPLQVLH